MAQTVVRLPLIGQISVKRGPAIARDARESAAVLQSRAAPTIDTAGQMGPGVGVPSSPLDRTGIPRTGQYRLGGNMATRPTPSRIDPETIKTLSRVYDVLRKAINIRKNEIVTLPWEITVRDSDRPGGDRLIKAKQEAIARITKQMQRPDRRRSYQSWLKRGLEDLFVGDYMSLSTSRSLRGDIMGWRFIDGSKIKPMTDLSGEIPARPGVAYQQFLYGLPRYDFFEADDPMPYPDALRLWGQSDFKNLDSYMTPGELRYRPMNPYIDAHYGMSNVEAFITHINNALRHQLWEGAFWTDGNVPSALIAAPETWTAEQIDEFQALWDALLAGDQAMQQRLRWVPHGSQLMQIDSALQHSSEYAEFLMNMTCLAMDVTRDELGWPQPKGGGKSAAGTDKMERHSERISLRPAAMYLKSEIFDPIIQIDCQEPDLEWCWPSLRAENERDRAETNQILIFSGQKSIDEIAVENGHTPPGIGRMLVTGAQVFFENDLVKGTKDGVAALLPATDSYSAAQKPHHPVEPGRESGQSDQPSNNQGVGGVPHTRKSAPVDAKEVAEDLKRWRRKTAKRATDADYGPAPFESDALPKGVRDYIAKGHEASDGHDEMDGYFARAIKHAQACTCCDQSSICDCWPNCCH